MITGTSRPIKDFLRQDRQYLIPRYQREYVWEEKQWDDLFDDLLKNYQKFSCNPSIEGHFIGSIVCGALSSADWRYFFDQGQA